jgi:hypothetical protein
VTELCSGQALGDADNDAADKSIPYVSPFQDDTKIIGTVKIRLALGIHMVIQMYKNRQ